MIIEIEKDIIKLSGNVIKNLWPSLQAATMMMLENNYRDIIVDCSQIGEITEEGLITFSEMFNFMEKQEGRIYFVEVNERIEKFAKKTPGIRSAMPIAESIEIARKSISIDKQMGKKYKTKDLLFPLTGNPAHAVMFGDLFVKKDREFTFVYPLLIPLKYTLYHPVKSLEDKANSDLGRVEGFCVFYERVAKKFIIRVRNYREYFKKTEEKFPNSHLLMSFAGCRFDAVTRDKLESFFERDKLSGIIVTEPYKKENPFGMKNEFNKIMVYITGEEKYDKQTVAFLNNFVKSYTVIKFIKAEKINFNESPKELKNYIEDFIYKKPGNVFYKTVSVRSRSSYFKEFIEKEKFDLVIMPILFGKKEFMFNMLKSPLCTTVFITPDFY